MSDLHYCGKHLQWVDKAFSFAVDHAIAAGAECAIMSGDSFDAEVPLHHPAVGLLLTRVRKLADHMPVLVLQGTFSHDRQGSLDVFRHVRGAHPIYVAEQVEQVVLAGGKWLGPDPLPYQPGLLVSALPSVNRAEIQAKNPDEETSSYIDKIMATWAPGNAHARALGVPTILVSHGTVNGCVTESKQAMISPDHEFGTASLFSAGASAVMLGHIHAHQSWELDGRRIAYPGSVTKLIYGHDQPTGYLLWDVQADRASFQFVETPARRLVDITFDGPPDPAELRLRLRDCKDAFVRVRWTVDEEHRHAVDQKGLRELMASAGVADCKLEGRINPVQRSRAAGISNMASIEDRLKRWCELTSTKPEPLMERLQIVQRS